MSTEQATIQTTPFLPVGKKAKGYLIGMMVVAVPIYLFCLYHSFFKADWRWLFLGIMAAVVSWYYVSVLGAVLAALTHIAVQPWPV